MSNVQPLTPPEVPGPQLASVHPLAGTVAARDDWLSACETAWTHRAAEPSAKVSPLREVRAIRAEAHRVGDEFVVAAADVVLLHEVVEHERYGEAIAGLVPAAADLETYPASTWLGRAHGILGTAFARLGEHARAVEHLGVQQEIGEVLEDLELQAEAIHAVALMRPVGPERLEGFAEAESLFARASIDRDDLAPGRLAARLHRASTSADLGLYAAAASQLPSVVELARSTGRPATEAVALALLGRCAALSGDVEAGLDLGRRALELTARLPELSRQDVLVEASATLVAAGQPDLAAAALEAPDLHDGPDLARRAAVLSQLAATYERLGRGADAFRTLRAADRLGDDAARSMSQHRLDALRVYHRTRSAERELTAQRDLSARLLEQVAHLGDAVPGADDVAIRDDVTGLPNRRYLDLELRWRCSHRLPGRSLLGLVVVTLDGLSDVRERGGQAESDRLLEAAGHVVRTSVRAGDAVARFGPDSFAVIQLHRSLESARFAGERLRQAIATYPWAQHRLGPVTVSIGIAALHPPVTPGALVGRATTAAGQARVDGGDRVRIAGP